MVPFLIFSTSYSKAKNENAIPCLRKLPSTKITNKTNETSDIFQHVFNKTNFTEKLTNDTIGTKQLSPKLLSARKRDGTFYNNKLLTAWRTRFQNFIPFVGILSEVNNFLVH